MKIHHGIDSLAPIKNPVVTVGAFDGVHHGHRVIIDRLKKIASEVKGETVVLTFYPHPRKTLNLDMTGFRLLNSLCEKEYLLKEAGIDHLVEIAFTPEFSRISSRDFVEKILCGKLGAKVVVVGYNHHFGHQRQGDFQFLYQMGKERNFEVFEIPRQDIENEKISSTVIRNALRRGDLQTANACLGRPYFFISEIAASGMLAVEESLKLIPPCGKYRVEVCCLPAEKPCSEAIAVIDEKERIFITPQACEIPVNQRVLVNFLAMIGHKC